MTRLSLFLAAVVFAACCVAASAWAQREVQAEELSDEMVPADPLRPMEPELPLPPPPAPPPPPLRAGEAAEPSLPEAPSPSSGAAVTPLSPLIVASSDRSPEEDAAFRALLRSIAPMDEAQLRALRRLLDRQALILAEPPSGTAPRPLTRAVLLTLRPGEELPRLRLFPGNATSVTFSDVTGAPWPIQSVTIGNPQAFAASEAGERGRTNMLVISPLTQRIVSNNIVVTLVGHPVPVVLGIDAGGEEVDYRVDVTVRARGPNAAPQLVQSSAVPPTNDRVVMAFLDGVPPRDAVPLRSTHRDVEIWRLGNRMYVRAPFEMMSPAYEARARNVSGVNVFTLGETPVLLMSEGGRMFQVMVRDAGHGASGGVPRSAGDRAAPTMSREAVR